MTEYGLVLGIIAIAVVAILAALRTQIVTIYQNVLSAITGTTTTPASTTTTTP